MLHNEVELKDEIWQKVVEITDAIQAEIEIEEENVDAIKIDDEVTLDVPLKRQRNLQRYFSPPR